MASTHTGHHHRSNIRVESSPADIEDVQVQYRKELARRFRKLRGVLRTTISENDALELGDPERRNVEEPESGPDITPVDDFTFEQSAGKLIKFNEQLQEWLDEGILEEMPMNLVRDGEHYTGIYAEAAYERGLEFGTEQLINAGIEKVPEENVKLDEQEARKLMGRPIHKDTLAQIYSRNYRQLEDITQAIDQQLSDILTDALRKGWNPRETADEINREIREIQRTRGRLIARTETMNAHNRAALKRYQGSGVTKVEILTHNPCEQCQRIEQRDPYVIEEGMRIVPAHPNCVCTYAPIV